ncbi:hypothetical protein PVAP13_1NG159800 [Panicum virgatum]|uniref:Uncharacterized protein n=2 Tax=Panicum virgatum TaxID=38727 RepID=A0A8T0WW97_PANVG|nr:hypothetical protein PVAP13_1NG159800 [Panicum virgatum]
MDMLSRTLFSVDLDTKELRCVMKEASLLTAGPTVSDLFPAVAADLQGARRRMGVLLRSVHGMIDEQFMRRRHCREAGEPSRSDMMDVVIDMEHEWEEEEGSHMNYDTVKTLFTDFFFAATETSSSAIEWAMAELLRCPEAMEKVREELRTVLGTRTEMEESDIAQLPYLQAVVKETLRLHPPISLSFYRAMAAVQVGGYTIPKGTNVILNIWAIHRKADTWAEPDKFMPERFIGSDTSFWGKHMELIPFGAGRRICLGLPLAHRMVHLMLGSLLHHFDWTLPTEVKENGVDTTEKFGLVVSMATPLKAIANKRCDG